MQGRGDGGGDTDTDTRRRPYTSTSASGTQTPGGRRAGHRGHAAPAGTRLPLAPGTHRQALSTPGHPRTDTEHPRALRTEGHQAPTDTNLLPQTPSTRRGTRTRTRTHTRTSTLACTPSCAQMCTHTPMQAHTGAHAPSHNQNPGTGQNCPIPALFAVPGAPGRGLGRGVAPQLILTQGLM